MCGCVGVRECQCVHVGCVRTVWVACLSVCFLVAFGSIHFSGCPVHSSTQLKMNDNTD